MKFKKEYASRVTLASLCGIAALFGSLTVHAAPTCVSTPTGTLTQGPYVLQNNMFGAADDATGTQNICNVGEASNAWTSQWNWKVGTGIPKAFPSIYVGWNSGTSMAGSGFPTQVMNQYQLPTKVKFSMSGSNTYATGYRVYFSPDPNPTKPSAEMQIWLSYAGVTPKGRKVYSNSKFNNPDESWDVWKGDGDEGWPVFTYVSTSQMTSFEAKLQPFIYCTSYTLHGFDKTWYTLGVQFGALVVQSNGAKGSIKVSSYSGLSN